MDTCILLLKPNLFKKKYIVLPWLVCSLNLNPLEKALGNTCTRIFIVMDGNLRLYGAIKSYENNSTQFQYKKCKPYKKQCIRGLLRQVYKMLAIQYTKQNRLPSCQFSSVGNVLFCYPCYERYSAQWLSGQAVCGQIVFHVSIVNFILLS